MKKNNTKLLVGVFLGIFSCIVLFSQDTLINPSQDTLINSSQKEILKKVLQDINKAPDFTLQSINDSTYTLSKMEDKVVLINFWATWCGPCRMEIPEFNELQEKYHKKGLEIVGISVSDTKKQLKNFIKSFNHIFR